MIRKGPFEFRETIPGWKTTTPRSRTIVRRHSATSSHTWPPVNECARVSNPAEFARKESTANPAAYGVKKLQALLVGRDDSESHYLGMRQNRVGVAVETNSNDESTLVLKIEKKDKFAVLKNSEGKFLTAQVRLLS